MKYLDLFSGCGGMSYGFSKRKFKCVGAVDFWNAAEAAYKKNFKKHEFRRLDLFEDSSVNEIIEWQKEQKPDLIIGGPPCQGFSTLGSRKEKDKRNNLIKVFLKIVKNVKPKYFVMENVKAIANTRYSENKRYGEFIKDYSGRAYSKEESSYNVHLVILNSLNFGTAQTRQRAFFIGVRKDIAFNRDEIDSLIEKQKTKPKTLQDVIFDLPNLNAGEGEDKIIVDGKVIHNHRAMGHGEELVKRFKCVPPGGGLLDVDDKLLTPHLKKMKQGKYGSGGHIKNVYGRLEWDKPCGTIIAGMDKITCGRYVHPEDHRLLTPRECARVQSFPDSFIFEGSQLSQYYLIGNAVPPAFSLAISKVLKEYDKNISQGKVRNESKQMSLEY